MEGIGNTLTVEPDWLSNLLGVDVSIYHGDATDPTHVYRVWGPTLAAFAVGCFLWAFYWSWINRESIGKGESRWLGKEMWSIWLLFFGVGSFMVNHTYKNIVPTIWEDNRLTSKMGPSMFTSGLADASDPQYRSFREGLPRLVPAMGGFLIFSLIAKAIFKSIDAKFNDFIPTTKETGGRDDKHAPKFRNVQGMMRYYVAVGLIFTTVLHGGDVLWVLLAVTTSMGIGKTLGASVWNPICSWIWTVFLVVSSDLMDGYPLSWLGPIGTMFESALGHGSIGWYVVLSISMLRMVSFNVDYYWALNGKPPFMKSAQKSDYLARVEYSLRPEDYSYLNGLAYMLYPPLFLGGPIITMNAFVSQVMQPQKSYDTKYIWTLTLREIIIFLGFEAAISVFPVYSLWEQFSIEQRNGIEGWGSKMFFGLSSSDALIIGFWVLFYTYLRFLILWRLFRITALGDGVDSPPNMKRCVMNLYSLYGFWRSWHQSFYFWTTRYLYLPLGGSKYQAGTVWIVFAFIGLWHDVEWRWFHWAMINCVHFVTEILLRLPFNKGAVLGWVYEPRNIWWQRWVFAVLVPPSLWIGMTSNAGVNLGFVGAPKFLYTALMASGWPMYVVHHFMVSCLCLFLQEWTAHTIRNGTYVPL